MSIFPKILLAIDGSESAELAARTVVDLSTRLDSELHVIYVTPEHSYHHAYYDLRHREEVEQFRREDQRVLDELADRMREAGGTVAETHLRVGEAAKEIVDLAEELGAGLIVMGSRGHSRISRLLMGSVSDSVVRHAHCSVLVVRGDEHGEEGRSYPPSNILLAFDGSKSSSEAAQAAAEIANATDSELHIVFVLQPDRYEPHLGPEMWEGWQAGLERAKQHARSWVEGQAERIRGERTKSVEAHLALGKPAEEIVRLAEELGAGLIVVGSRGLGGIRRALIGSVSDSVVRHAHSSVLVVRVGEAIGSRKVKSA
jgi:nucleotide-binding universal stress UspA family protein